MNLPQFNKTRLVWLLSALFLGVDPFSLSTPAQSLNVLAGSHPTRVVLGIRYSLFLQEKSSAKAWLSCRFVHIRIPIFFLVYDQGFRRYMRMTPEMMNMGLHSLVDLGSLEFVMRLRMNQARAWEIPPVVLGMTGV